MQIKHHPFTYDVRSNLFHKTFLHPPFVFGSPANLWCDETSLVLHFCLSTPENWNNLQQNQIFRYNLFFFSSIKSAKTKSVDHLSLSLYPLEIETFASFDHSISSSLPPAQLIAILQKCVYFVQCRFFFLPLLSFQLLYTLICSGISTMSCR